VNTLLADPPALASPEQPSATGAPGAQPPGAAPESPSAAATPQPVCANCGAPMESAQDWCLQCGAGAPGSLNAGGPSWRSAATMLAAIAILVLGAAAAGYAALSKEGAHKPRLVTVKVAQAPAAPTPPTSTPLTPGVVTPTPKALGTPTTLNPLAPTGAAKPSKIPLSTPTPKSSGTSTKEASPTTTSANPPTKSGGGTTTTTTEPTAPILLDTDAASTYNPYNYPASEFGDPSLAIDGETSTGWTAQVNPAVAPKMAEGVAIDLKTAQKVSALTLITSTPGMTVQVYGANVHTLPTSITDPAWVALSPARDAKKRKTHIKLRDSRKAFRFFTLWISNAPAASVGAPPDRVPPAHVSVNELELFPTK
jgi:hypothetical protein